MLNHTHNNKCWIKTAILVVFTVSIPFITVYNITEAVICLLWFDEFKVFEKKNHSIKWDDATNIIKQWSLKE